MYFCLRVRLLIMEILTRWIGLFYLFAMLMFTCMLNTWCAYIVLYFMHTIACNTCLKPPIIYVVYNKYKKCYRIRIPSFNSFYVQKNILTCIIKRYIIVLLKVCYNLINIRSLTCFPLLICRCVGDLKKQHFRSLQVTSCHEYIMIW